MVKRRRGIALQRYNAKRRREAEAAEAENQDPAIQDVAPQADAPVDQPAAPVVQVAPPIQEAVPPAEQAAPPVVQAANPVQQAAPPSVQAAPPVQEAAPPVPEAALPAEQAAPPVVQAANPVQQAAPPNVQVAPPVQQPAPTPKTEAEITKDILTELAEKQKKHIEEAENLLAIWNDRYTRLAYYESFILNFHERKVNITKLVGRLNDLEAECTALDKKEELLVERINSMKEQIKRLEEVFKESGRYHGQEINIEQKEHVIEMKVPDQTFIDSDLNSFPTLNDLLVNTGASARVRAPTPLLQNDLDEIKWPEEINYDKYSVHLNKKTELADDCQNRRQRIVILEIKMKKSPYRFLQRNKEEIERLYMYPEIRETRVKSHQDLIKAKYAKWKSFVMQKHIKRSTIAAFKEEEKRLSALQKSRDAQFEKIRKQVNQEECKCEICLQLMTNGDSSLRCPKIFGSCGHTACAECMIQFKDPVVDQQWRCPECRTQSTEIFTNWTVMKKINPEWQHKKIHIE